MSTVKCCQLRKIQETIFYCLLRVYFLSLLYREAEGMFTNVENVVENRREYSEELVRQLLFHHRGKF